MNKINILALFVFIITSTLSAQYAFNGIRTSKRAGILGATINPAELANMPQKVDVHLFGMDVNIANNVVSLSSSGLSKLDSFEKNFLNKVSSEGLTARLNFDIMGPSGAFAINSRMTVGLITRARLQAAVNNLDIATAKALLSNETLNNFSLPYTTPNINSMSMNLVGWGELGGLFSMKFYETDKHSLSGGAGIKAIFPGGYANSFVTNFKLSIDTNAGGDVRISNGSGSLGIEYSGSNDPMESIFSNMTGAPRGIGFDIGASYQYKDKETGEYILKIGASIVDIGSMSFQMNAKNSKSYIINPIANFDPKTIRGSNLDEIIKNIRSTGIATEVPLDSTQTISLPTALNITADWNIWKPFYLTVHLQRSLTNKDNPRSLQAANFIGFTPRISYKLIEAYLPISISGLQGFNMGMGIKLGPMYFGTSSLISALISENNKAFDFHAGLRFGIGKRKKED
ncbi:MAG: hypothetical protein JNL75_10945 [Chitinophagales bacterium]|nr:hypothetical protein [Chitinophagales bacterium]